MYAIETSVVTLYSFDQQGVFCGDFQYKWVAGTGLAANSTLTPPPQASEGFAYVWDGESWGLKEDHRGKTVYSKIDKTSKEIDYVGDIEENYTLLVPGQFDAWGGEVWEDQRTDAEKLQLKRELMRELDPVEFEIMLSNHGYYDAIYDVIATNRTLKSYYTRSVFFKRLDAHLEQIRVALNISHEQLDQMWLDQ